MSNWKKYHVRRWKRCFTSFRKICQSCRSFDFDTEYHFNLFMSNCDTSIYRVKVYVDGVLVQDL